MPDKRKIELDIDLIGRLLKQLESEYEIAAHEESVARASYEEAQAKRIKALEYVLQMRGEQRSLPAVNRDELNKEDSADRKESSSEHKIETLSGNNSIHPKSASTFIWEAEGFQWRRYLPTLIARTDQFMSIGDIMSAMGMDDAQKQKNYATVSSALSVLAKVGESLVAINIPRMRAALYGLPRFVDESGNPTEEYMEKLRRRNLV